jgi:hypothetical protein
VYAVDAKLNFDDNAEFRQKEIYSMRDWSEEDPREVQVTNLQSTKNNETVQLKFELNKNLTGCKIQSKLYWNEWEYWMYGEWCWSCNGNDGYH